jgi:hypothetical protein
MKLEGRCEATRMKSEGRILTEEEMACVWEELDALYN